MEMSSFSNRSDGNNSLEEEEINYNNEEEDEKNNDNNSTMLLPENFEPTFARKALIFTTYACVIFAISSPLTSYPAMQKDVPGFDQSSSFFVIGVATAGTGLGKILPGYLVARFGARKTYLFLILTLGLLCSTLSICNSVGTIAIVQFFIEFSAGSAWPSHNEIVRGHFGSNMLGKGIQTISLSSRSSDMVGKLMYGSILYVGISWRWVARLAAALCIVGAVLSSQHRDSHQKADVRREASLRDIFNRTVDILCRKRYWQAVGVYMLLTVLKKSGQLIPVYFLNTSDPKLVNTGIASWLGTLFQCGLLIGIFGGGYLYNSISNIKKKGLVLTLLLMSTGAGVALVIVGVHVTNSAAMLVFRGGLVVIFATGVGLAYYIPIGIFVVKIGKEDTATVSALMDIVGYAFGSLFFVAVLTPMVEYLGWFWVWSFYAGVSFLSAILANGFLNMLYETDWSTVKPDYIFGSNSKRSTKHSRGGSFMEDQEESLLDNDLHNHITSSVNE